MRFPPPPPAVCMSWLVSSRLLIIYFLLPHEASLALTQSSTWCASLSCLPSSVSNGSAISPLSPPSPQSFGFTRLTSGRVISHRSSPVARGGPRGHSRGTAGGERCSAHQHRRLLQGVSEPGLLSSFSRRADGAWNTVTEGPVRRPTSGVRTPGRRTVGALGVPRSPLLGRPTRFSPTQQDRHFPTCPILFIVLSIFGCYRLFSSRPSSLTDSCPRLIQEERPSLRVSSAPQKVLHRHDTFRCTYTRNEIRLDRPRTLPPRCVFNSSPPHLSSTTFPAVPPQPPVTSSAYSCHRRRSSTPSSLFSGNEFEDTSRRQVDHRRPRGFLRETRSEVRSGQKSLQAARRDRRLPSEAFDQLKRLLEAKQYEVFSDGLPLDETGAGFFLFLIRSNTHNPKPFQTPLESGELAVERVFIDLEIS